MFSNNKNNVKGSTSPATTTGVNSIVYGTEIIGEIKAPGNFRVDGKVNGNMVIEGRLIIGAKGVIEGDVKCKSAEIEGLFKGNIIVDEILSLRSNAQIYGDAIFNKLKVEEGAQLSCSCNLKRGHATPKNDGQIQKNKPIQQTV